jgi:AcrR family transcriptional regulator
MHMRLLPLSTDILQGTSAASGRGSALSTRLAPSRSTEKKRLTAHGRREQLLETAAAEFAKSGFHATTTAALAKAAGVSEPVLYAHFPDKECLFRDVVKRDSEERVRALQLRISSLAPAAPRQCIEELFEATISACLKGKSGPVLTNWALLELPEFAADLHRQEIGTVAAIWQENLSARFSDVDSRPVISGYTFGCVQVCYSYALWLGAVRHTQETAAPLAKEFTAWAAEAACALIRAGSRRRKWRIETGA